MPPPLHNIQPSFAGGEFTPALYGRVDINKYLTGARRLRNVNVMPHGGVRNRPGTKMVGQAGISASAVRLIPFVVSKTQAYIIELGDKYARFYTQDAQVEVSVASAWVTGSAYAVGNFVSNAGTIYYCIVAHTAAAAFATDLAAGKWRAQTHYEIPTPWAAADLFSLKFAQSAAVMYFAHPSYAPEQLTFASSTSWTLTTYSFINGPFMLQNTDTAFTLAASALSGSVTLTASKSLFDTSSPSKHIGALVDMIWTVVGQTITPSLTAAAKNWIATNSTWSATTTGTWTGTILIQTSPDNVTWTTVSTVTSNTTVSGATGFTNGYMRAIMQSSLAFSGSATVALTGNGNSNVTNLGALNAASTPVAAGDTASTTITGIGVQTVKLQKSTDGGSTWTDLASYTTNHGATGVATGETACLIRALCSAYTSGGPAVVTVDGTTGAAPTLSFAVSTASVSQAIQCGQNWSAITTGGWTGKLRVEVSVDGGNNWQLAQTFSSSGSNNFNTSGQTGFSQCLLRVSTDPTVAFTGPATIDLTSGSFDWEGIVKITAVASATSATATVQSRSNQDSSGLSSTSATWQWSEGSWSTFRGWPSCVTFFQERLCWGSTSAEPATGWCSKTSSYADFGVSSPIVASDSLSFVLPSRQLNAIQSFVVMPTAMLALTSDSEWSIAAGSDGVFSPTSAVVNYQGSRGSSGIDPAIVGNELILVQQMGTVVRNLIFQLAVQGFFGDNVSLISQHLFTGFSIKEMAYQQEPDSIIWAVRSDGKLLSLTYLREQEISAWTWHDTKGTFESVAVIPNATLNINEVWFVVNRTINGVSTRFIERLTPRDNGTAPEDQFFVDCGLSYSGAPATVFAGLDHLNGASVSILADGNVIADGGVSGKYAAVTVAGGQITLAIAASKVSVGLPYVSDVETLKIESPDQRGTLQGRRVTIPKITMRFWNSRGGYVGTKRPSDDGISGLDPILQRGPSDNINAAIPLKTDDFPVTPAGGYSKDAHMLYRQIDPLPFSILAFIPQLVAGES